MKITAELTELAEPGKATLQYRVELGNEGFRTPIILDSPLGLMLEGQDFTHKLRFESADGPKRIEESYTMPHGKRRECRNVAQHLTLGFRSQSGQLLELELRTPASRNRA